MSNMHIHMYTCEDNLCIHVLNLNSPVYLVCDALVEVLWLLCIVYVIRAQQIELPW